jgi:hypothetical protein
VQIRATYKFLKHEVLEVPRTVNGHNREFKISDLREYKKLMGGI